jgi:dTDP-4-amino-4,6-dideoxygalactose transaminase
MCITDDARLYDRLMGYHDTAACWRPDRFARERYEGELFCGTNYRMSELTGAVMLAQLEKLDGLLADMRRNKARIKSQIQGLKGITFRRLNDEAGDSAICLIFMLDDKSKVQTFSEALQAEGVAANGIFNKGIPDWHIYHHWKHIMTKATPTHEGCPWTCPYHKGPEVQYTEDQCPQILENLARAIHLDIPSQMTLEDCDMVAKGIRKVAVALL